MKARSRRKCLSINGATEYCDHGLQRLNRMFMLFRPNRLRYGGICQVDHSQWPTSQKGKAKSLKSKCRKGARIMPGS